MATDTFASYEPFLVMDCRSRHFLPHDTHLMIRTVRSIVMDIDAWEDFCIDHSTNVPHPRRDPLVMVGSTSEEVLRLT